MSGKKKGKKIQFKIIKEFKAFITRGNVIDLAVGMIVGAAFTAIVNALVNNIFKPLINAIPMGGVEGLITMLVAKTADGLTLAQAQAAGVEFIVDLSKSVYIDWGAFIMAIINFLLTAVVLFSLVKVINTLRDGWGGLKKEAAFLNSLTDEEKAELKKQGFSRRQIKKVQAERAAEAAAAAKQAEEEAKAAAAKVESVEDILKDIRTLLARLNEADAKAVLEESLCMGADEGLLLSDRAFGGADVLATSYCLSLGVKKFGDFDLVLCGKQTTDGDTAQVGPELAERLGIDHAANVLKIDAIDDKFVTVTIDLDGIEQTQKMALPCLLTLEKDANSPRLPSYLKKKAIRPEQISICSSKDFPDANMGMLGLKGSPTQVERIFPPAVNTEQSKLSGTPDELACQLRDLLVAEKFI